VIAPWPGRLRAVLLAWAIALFLSVQTVACAQTGAAIDIRAQPLRGFDLRDPSRQQFGELFFRGGLVLQSSFRHFGGLSAIRMAVDAEHFISLTDKGWWLRARLQYEGKRPERITEAEMAPILGPTGSPLAARGWYDTEAIAEDDGTLYVAIERVHRIVRFDYAKEGLRARGQPIPVPREMRSLPANKGIEALVCRTQRAAPCRRVDRNFRTRPRCRRKHHRISDRRRRPGMFTVKRIDSFDVSDAALVPGGDLLLLERKFSWMGGLFIRIRRISLAPSSLVQWWMERPCSKPTWDRRSTIWKDLAFTEMLTGKTC
jgi:hypothetical protein